MTEGGARTTAQLMAGALLLTLLAGTVASCGGPAVGDIEGQVLGLVKSTEQPVLLRGATVVIAGHRVDCGRRTDRCVAQTGVGGRYRFDDLPAGDYGVAISYTAPDLGTRLQPETRQLNVSGGQAETLSAVLLAEGIERPPVPAPGRAGDRPAAGIGPGLGGATDPFFWYFLFSAPHLFGYPRPPVVVYGPGGDSGRTVVIDRDQPPAPRAGRRYTTYAPPGDAARVPGAKPPPRAPDSKGVTRPGGTAARPSVPVPAAPVPGSADVSRGARGETRPGLRPPSAAVPDAARAPATAAPRGPAVPPRVTDGRRARPGLSSAPPPRITAPNRAPAPPRISSLPRVRAGRR